MYVCVPLFLSFVLLACFVCLLVFKFRLVHFFLLALIMSLFIPYVCISLCLHLCMYLFIYVCR